MYTPQNAKQLLAEYNQILDRINEIYVTLKNNKSEIISCANLLVKKKSLDNTIRRYLENDDLEFNVETEHLFQLLYIHKKIYPTIFKLAVKEKVFREKSIKCVDYIKSSGYGIRRVFSSKAKKQSAETAYEELSELLNPSFKKSIEDTLNLIESVKAEEKNAELLTHSFSYAEYWNELCMVIDSPEKIPGDVSCINRITGKWNEVLSYKEDKIAEKELQKISESIKRNVDSMIVKNIVEDLKSIPVEELNREKRGIRVKTLSDNGYKTIADIYVANAAELSNINGISYDTAILCKSIAREFGSQARRNRHFKINADNKTPIATSIVSGVYKYKQIIDLGKEKNDLIDNAVSELPQKLEKINKTGNGMAWLFSDVEKKSELKQLYSELKNADASALINRLQEQNRKIKSLAESPDEAWKAFRENPIEYYNILETIVPGVLGDSNEVYGLPEDLAREIQDEAFFPDGLLCTLRPYQELGVKYTLHQKKVLIGDEMGLGKTIQAIAAMVSLRNTGATHFMVVCPASVLENWFREIKKHSKLRAVTIHGADRLNVFNEWCRSGGVGVTTFETISRLEMDYNFRFHLLVVDEAHYVKNPQANRTQNLIRISKHTDRMMFMTGTAMENKVDEMVSLISILNADLASRIKNVAYMQTAEQFRNDIVSVYYRRKREDVLQELPELIENEEWCTLSGEERRRYNAAVISKQYADIRRVSWNVGDVSNSCKARRMKEIADEAKADDRKILVFSFFLNTIEKVQSVFGEDCYGPITGSVKPEKRQSIIDAFDKGPAGSVLVAQIQSGGTGLNIQSASVVIFCEPQFKPSIENQAISRAYRMGQARNVFVHRLLCTNTVDERIMDILDEKQRMFDAFADKSAAAEAGYEIDETSFGKIIEEEIERIKAEQKRD